MRKITFGWAQIVLMAVLLAIPITYLVSQSEQDIRQRAQIPDQIPTKIYISPGKILTAFDSQPIRMSAELLDEKGRPIKNGVTFEWGISSKYTVGTLIEVNQNLASFKPQNDGSGDIYIKATYEDSLVNKILIGSIPVVVLRGDPQPTATPMASIGPPATCLQAGGTWRTDFPNSCVDYCFEPGAQPVCAQVISSGCDCGPQKCWSGTTCIDNPQEKASPSPTATSRPFYTVYDLEILLYNYLTNADIMYQPQDQKVNMWDGGYVIKFLIREPILCQVCQTDDDCPISMYCTNKKWCRYSCLNSQPPCLMPEPVCE